MVASLWCHLEHHALGGAKNKLHCGQRDMCSWSMVNNEENWLPWQIEDWFNKNKKSLPKSAQSLWLVKFQVPNPQRVKEAIITSSRVAPLIPTSVPSVCSLRSSKSSVECKVEFILRFHKYSRGLEHIVQSSIKLPP